MPYDNLTQDEISQIKKEHNLHSQEDVDNVVKTRLAKEKKKQEELEKENAELKGQVGKTAYTDDLKKHISDNDLNITDEQLETINKFSDGDIEKAKNLIEGLKIGSITEPQDTLNLHGAEGKPDAKPDTTSDAEKALEAAMRES